MKTKYLSTAKNLVYEAIYSRGVAMFLEKRVIEFENIEEIPGWRVYTVRGNTGMYEVQFPLIHIINPELVDPSRIIREFTKCDCEYYAENGVCKHIVAVCADLDREFSHSKPPSKKELTQFKSILDNFSLIDSGKKVSNWLESFRYVFDIEDFDLIGVSLRSIEGTVRESFAEPARYPLFFKGLQEDIHSRKSKYLKQKNIVEVATYTRFWLITGKEWFELFNTSVQGFEDVLQIKFYAKVWMIFLDYPSLFSSFFTKFSNTLSQLSKEIKTGVVDFLVEEKVEMKDVVEFAYTSDYKSFLKDHIDELNTEQLVRLLRVLPDESEHIDTNLEQQFKAWSDFLDPSQYKAFSTLFDMWRENGAGSSSFDNVYEYVLLQHKKKKAFIKLVK
jgi:hypothetical protein